jgi:hypothetical protein
VKVPDNKEVAIHVVPESCVGRCEAADEALTGVRAGQPLSHEMFIHIRVPTSLLWRKAIRAEAPSQAFVRPGGVRDPGMHVRSSRGNREICEAIRCRSHPALIRIGKA